MEELAERIEEASGATAAQMELNKKRESEVATVLVDRPTQLIIGIFVELAVATPVERRTFVLVVPTVKKSKLGPISFQNIRIMCIQEDKMQKTGQNSGKKC